MLRSSANPIEPTHALVLSQHRVNSLGTDLPLKQSVSIGTIFSMVLLSTITLLIYARTSKLKQPLSKVNLLAAIRCSRCQYFNNNHFLNCALHPVTIMTERAVDCLDYCPKAEAKQVEKLRKVLLNIQKVFF